MEITTESPDEYPSTSSTPLGRRCSYKYGKGNLVFSHVFQELFEFFLKSSRNF